MSESRFRVRIRTGAAGAGPVDLVLPSRVEAAWVAALVRVAAAGEAIPHRCPGCGAPATLGIEERAGGQTKCDYCGAGFVVDVRGIRWQPVVLPCPDAGPLLRPPAGVEVGRARGRDAALRTWRLRPDSLAARVGPALGFAANVLFFGAFGGATVWLSQHTPPGAVGLTLLVLVCAVMMLAVAGFALALTALALFGSEVVAVDEARLWSETRVAGLALPGEPRGATPGRGASPSAVRRMAGSALPIARLTRVALEREGLRTRLRFHTPTRSLELEWRLPPAEDRWLRRELALALAERLRAVGREVVLERG